MHELFLRGSDAVCRHPLRDLSVDASEDAARRGAKAGLIPLKTAKYQAAMRVVEVLEKFRASTGAFTQGKAEQTLIWREGAQWARCLVDWLPDDPAVRYGI